jgi:glycosyltransferase involved in cell wall biosynthesis
MNIPTKTLRVAFVLPGLHRVCRGAEVALESVAAELAKLPSVEVTLFGSGAARPEDPYRFVHIGNIPRERFEKFPSFPIFRSEYAWEEATFIPGLLARYNPAAFDVTVTCSYPFVQWAVQLLRDVKGRRPKLVFVTQNGDHVVHAQDREFRWFFCDGLVCTNPDYFQRNHRNWPSRLIPNGVDPAMFFPGVARRNDFDLPPGVPIALMVSALIESKRVDEGIRAAAKVPGLHLVVCGDGPERERVHALGAELMGARFHPRSLPRAQMPMMYRCADLFLHMSLDEPSANAYIEALATGLPIVTHDRHVTQWTLEETGVLVDATNLAAVSAGIIVALGRKTPRDVAARRTLAETRFSWCGIAGQYHGFFLQLLSGEARRDP